VAYLAAEEQEVVRDALGLAFWAHDGQKRKSGEPFIIHPVEVTRILAELEMDWESLVAGLLHDTVEDTDRITFGEIEAKYGVRSAADCGGGDQGVEAREGAVA